MAHESESTEAHEDGSQSTEEREGEGPRVLGLIADPDMPAQVGARLAGKLTDWLGENNGGEWTVEVVSDPVTAGESDPARILESVAQHRSRNGWVCAICLTDLPLLLRDRPLLADTQAHNRVALVSLPALGGTQPYRRMRQMLTQLLEDLLDVGESRNDPPRSRLSRRRRSSSDHRLYSWLTNLIAPVHRESGEDGVRYTASRVGGWLRLVTGMVRTNRPWQLVFGLSSALAAAIATSAFGLSSSTIWQIGDALDLVRESLAAVASVVLLVFWLISAHGLWERRRNRRTHSGRLMVLYNSSTVLTLLIGVGCLYAGLFLINVCVALFLVPSSVLASSLGHPANYATYLNLAWGFTTMGVIAGALGSSLESDRAVRQAAYGYREEQRRGREQSRKEQEAQDQQRRQYHQRARSEQEVGEAQDAGQARDAREAGNEEQG